MDAIFKCIFFNENVWISIKISLEFVLKGPIDSNPALVQIMAWCRIGDKPLSEPMMDYVSDAYMRHLASIETNPYLSHSKIQVENHEPQIVFKYCKKSIIAVLNKLLWTKKSSCIYGYNLVYLINLVCVMILYGSKHRHSTKAEWNNEGKQKKKCTLCVQTSKMTFIILLSF